MPLPSTGPWEISAGAIQGTLTFNDTTGVVSGVIEEAFQFSGFFDETAQTLTFMISDPLVTKGGFKGVLSTPFTVYNAQLFEVGSGDSAYFVLTGVFWESGDDLSVSYATWYAQFPAPTKVPPPPTPPPTPHPKPTPHPLPTPHPITPP